MDGGGGYWTDASSLDGLSTCSDVEDSKPSSSVASVKSALFSPTLSLYSVGSTACTPTPVNPPISSSHPTKIAYLIGASLSRNSELINALDVLQIDPIYVNELEFNLSTVDTVTSIFIFEEFIGALFDSLRKKAARLRIFGPPVVIDTANSCGNGEKTLPQTKSGYPIYSRLLKNCRISVTGIRTKDELYNIRRRILYLDGIFLEREGPPTHLIAAKCRGNKYRDAVALDKPILKPEWLDFLWQKKDERGFDISKSMDKYKVRAFYGSKIALEGFDDTEKVGMIKLIEENEGFCVGAADPTVTHIVRGNSVTNLGTLNVNEGDVLADLEDIRSPLKRARFEPSVINDFNETDMGEKGLQGHASHGGERAKILKAEWFWTSIQIEACADENAYQFDKEYGDETLNNSIGTPNSFSSPLGPMSDTDGGTPTSGTPGSIGRRKRKRLIKDFMSALAHVDHPKSIMEVDEPEDNENVDLGGKSLDQLEDDVSDAELASILKRIGLLVNPSDLKTMSPRHIEYLHLIETERNYVTILMNIIKIFKEPCEQEDQKAGRLLTPLEVKTIFNPILPIYSLHRRVLRDMLKLLESWTEESLIGEIYVKYAQELRKCYEPYVEYFETIKNEIIRCETESPRFMAFLRIAQGKPQCGKQKLVELIIRPVQRLPSTALILKNLEKHTPKSNPDAEWITKGVEAIDRVNQTINQKKERADARVAMFDIFHDIEGCPVELISDHRSILKKYDVLSMNDVFGQKNELLTLCVFSDHFQVVKRRNLGGSKNMSSAMSMANLRSPAVSRKSFMHGASSGYSQQKRYKFLEWVQFCHVRKIVRIHDMEPKSFAFIVREPDEVRERCLVFTVPDDPEMEKHEKMSVVEFFAKQLAQSVARVDYEQFITTVDAATVRVHESSSVLEKAARFATKTKNKVGRALSLSRTPSKIKRTMSQMMSPFSSRSVSKDPDSVSQSGSEASITPMRNNLSSMSLWFGSKRGTMDGQSTPKARKTINEKDAKKGFSAIQET